MRRGWNRNGSLKNRGGAAGEGGAGLEMPAGEIRRGAVGMEAGEVDGKFRCGGRLDIPDQGGVKCEVE